MGPQGPRHSLSGCYLLLNRVIHSFRGALARVPGEMCNGPRKCPQSAEMGYLLTCRLHALTCTQKPSASPVGAPRPSVPDVPGGFLCACSAFTMSRCCSVPHVSAPCGTSEQLFIARQSVPSLSREHPSWNLGALPSLQTESLSQKVSVSSGTRTRPCTQLTLWVMASTQ